MKDNIMYQLTYGLFVLSAREGDKDNGCIINTAFQVTSSPNRIAITINKNNYTHDMVYHTKIFNVSFLTVASTFEVYRNFGFQSGRDTEKFVNKNVKRSDNGLIFLEEHTNGYLSGRVVETFDLGTHSMFIADVIDGEVFNQEESVTYSYYQKNIKPSPKKDTQKKAGYVCSVCGHVYEGKLLPEDYICPICYHDSTFFNKIP